MGGRPRNQPLLAVYSLQEGRRWWQGKIAQFPAPSLHLQCCSLDANGGSITQSYFVSPPLAAPKTVALTSLTTFPPTSLLRSTSSCAWLKLLVQYTKSCVQKTLPELNYSPNSKSILLKTILEKPIVTYQPRYSDPLSFLQIINSLSIIDYWFH